MSENERPFDRQARMEFPTGGRGREPRASVAYAVYAQKALLGFDLETKAETIRQHRARLSLREAVGDAARPESARAPRFGERGARSGDDA